MDLEFILELPIITALLIVLAGILVDTAFGVWLSLQDKKFDIRILPQFLASAVLPHVGGLVVLAFVGQNAGKVFAYLFYTVAMAVLAKYLAEIKDKIRQLFGIEIS